MPSRFTTAAYAAPAGFHRPSSSFSRAPATCCSGVAIAHTAEWIDDDGPTVHSVTARRGRVGELVESDRCQMTDEERRGEHPVESSGSLGEGTGQRDRRHPPQQQGARGKPAEVESELRRLPWSADLEATWHGVRQASSGMMIQKMM